MVKKLFLSMIGFVLIFQVTTFAMEAKQLTLKNIHIEGNYIVGTNYSSISLENVKVDGLITFESNAVESINVELSEDCEIGGIIFSRQGTLINYGHINSLKIDAPVIIKEQGAIRHAIINNNANINNDGEVIIIKNGQAINASGFISILGNEYYASANNTLAKGMTEINGKSYFFDDTYVRKLGFVKDGDNAYHIDEGGNIAKGVSTINGKKYYFDEAGIMQKGLLEIEGEAYYFLDNGSVKTGFSDIDGKKYYFNENGVMAKNGWVDAYYRAGNDGVLAYSRTDNAELDGIAERVLSGIIKDNMTEREKMYAIYNWMPKNIGWRGVITNFSASNADRFETITYSDDEIINMALYAYRQRKGSCEHYASLASVLLKRLGYETEVVYGLRKGYAYAGNPWGEHAWVIVTIDGEKYHFDPQYTRTHMKNNLDFYFLLPEEDSKEHHRW